jgi:DNA repair photolyase
MSIRKIQAKSILRRAKKVDSWFISGAGMNLYRGCAHNCVYCDGRAEKYNVDGEFGRDVAVKVNAPEILRRELDPARKRKPMDSGYVCLGGGVGDAYQPLDKRYALARTALELIHEYHYPVHVLTKSMLVERDMDIIKRINEERRAIVSFSYSSLDDEISRIFEPGVPLPSERLAVQARFREQGIPCGMMLMPVIPFITDKPEFLDNAVKKASESGFDFVVFGGMTLKQGRQRDFYFRSLQKHRPELITEYDMIYKDDKWGRARREYYDSLYAAFHQVAGHYKMPTRVPLKLFKGILNKKDLVVVLLEHMDYFLKVRGSSSPYGYAAYSLSQIKEPLESIRYKLKSIKGIGPGTATIIKEIMETGTSGYYEKLTEGQ